MKQDHPIYKSSYSYQIFDLELLRQAYLFGSGLGILNSNNFTEKLILLDEVSIFFIVFSNHWRNRISESFSVNKPKKWGFECFDWSWSGCWIEQSHLSETLPRLNVSFDDSVDLNG